MNDGTVESAGTVSVSRAVTPVLRKLTAILAFAFFCASSMGLYTLLSPRRFQAELSFSTVSAGRSNSLAGALPAALLAAATVGGLQATPALLARLVRSHNVAVHVARRVVPSRGDSTVADVLLHRSTARESDALVAKALADIITADNDRETGLVTVGAASRDSVLARFVVEQVVSEVTTAFQNAVRSQVTETKSSLTQRLEVASTRLRDVEERERVFAFRNRQVAPYSDAALERDRLQRELALAQTLYSQVATERENAKDREAESVPAVVIVDPIPRQLRPLPRRTVLKVGLGFLGGFTALASWFVLLHLLRSSGTTNAEADAEFQRALDESWLTRRMKRLAAHA